MKKGKLRIPMAEQIKNLSKGLEEAYGKIEDLKKELYDEQLNRKRIFVSLKQAKGENRRLKDLLQTGFRMVEKGFDLKAFIRDGNQYDY